MMRRIIAWSMQLRLVILAAAAVLVFFGFTELRKMPLDAVPEFSQQYVEVQTEALGLSASEVEAMITVPLEADMLNGVPWVEEIRSESIPGLSSIVMVFEPGIDMLTARQMVMEHLTEVFALPNVSKPPQMLQPVSSANRFLKVGLTSDSLSLIDLSVQARWTIVPRLMGVPGVANVSIWGRRERQLQVQVDPEELHSHGVTLQQVIETTGNALWMSPLTFLDASTPGTGGWIETPNQRLGIQHILPISTAEDLAKVTVANSSLRLGDVAHVVEDHQPMIGDALVDDVPALMLVVEKYPWANTVEVTKATEAALAALQLGLPGVQLDPSLYRPATYLEMVRENLSSALVIAFVLAAAALFALFFSWRPALVSTVALLSSVLAALAVLYLRDVTINAMVVAGLVMALAVLVDDAIVDIQNVRRRLRERAGGGTTAGAIFEGALEMRGPLLYASVILLLAVAPVYFLEGVGGGFARPIVLSYALALLTSFAVALTVTPALGLLFLGEAGSRRESPLLAALRAPFDAVLSGVLRAPRRPIPLAVGALGLLVLIGMVTLRPAGEVIPNFQERDILINLDAAPGTSEAAMGRIASRASRELRAIPGVRNVSAHLGRAIMSDRVSDVNAGELWVSIDPAADYQATLAGIRETMEHYPGLDIDVQTYLNERIREETEDDDHLTVRVYGEDLDEILAKAEEVQKLLLLVNGVVDPEVEYLEVHPELQIEVDLARSKHYGVKPGDVRRAAATLLSGLEVGSLFEDQKVFEVVVWGTPETRHSLTEVENLLIDSPAGGQVRLGDVANLRIESVPRVIERESVARHIDVTGGVDGDVGAVVAEIEQRLRQQVGFPLEMRAEVHANYAAKIAGERRVAALAVGAAIAIVLLLQVAFSSWSLAFLFFLTLPVALLGAVLTGMLRGDLASLGSLLGLGAVFGLAVRNGITTIRHYRALQRHEKSQVSPELVLRGTRDRLAPILMTAVVSALAVLPFALLGNIAGHEILYPMAVAVLGGLVSATLVNVLVVPALYLAFGASAASFELEAEEEAAA